MQDLRQLQQFFTFAFHQLAYRYPGPAGDHFCDFFFTDFLFQKTSILTLICLLLFFFQLLFQVRQSTVFQLCQFLQIIVSLCIFDIMFYRFDLLLDDFDLGNGFFLAFPLSTHGIAFIF